MDALPQWTTKIDKRGLDPLGMQNAGVVLYQALLPGISNITLRMRYYGFFCWLSDAYARRGVATDFEIWRQWVRRAEALLALVAYDDPSASSRRVSSLANLSGCSARSFSRFRVFHWTAGSALTSLVRPSNGHSGSSA